MEQMHNNPHTPQVPEEKKDALTKTFAIAGFAAIIIFIVWLAVQVVQIAPNAFSSLASLADSVYNYDVNQELVVSTNNTVINAGESFTLNWSELAGTGEYTFSYACTEGVALEIKNADGQVVSQACDTQLALGKETTLDILVASGQHRFVDVALAITYANEGDEEDMKKTAKTVTIVNAAIPANGIAEVEEEVEEEEEVVVSNPKPTTIPKPPVYTTVPKVTYVIPVSNPNGFVDLQVTYLGIGTLSGTKFTPAMTLDLDSSNAAMQFEIKNIGTKTSASWSYEAELPADINYTSPTQKELKPNERAIITLGFDGLTQDGIETVRIEATTSGDKSTANNTVTKTVQVVD